MHVPINVKFPNNISEWQMEFNSAFKGLILSDFNYTSIFLADFRKILTFNLTKIRPVGVEAYHAHGRT